MKHPLYNYMDKEEYIFGFCYMLAQQFFIPFSLGVIVVLLDLPLSDLWLNFILFCMNFLCISIVFRRYLQQNLLLFLRRFKSALAVALGGFALYWVANVVLSIFISICFPDFSNANDANIQSMAENQYWVMFTGSVILVPLAEETLYRGVLFGFADRYSRVLAFALSTVLFALIHVIGYIGTVEPLYLLVSFLQYVPAGLCLSWAYAESGTIFAPVLIHTAVNLLGMLAMR